MRVPSFINNQGILHHDYPDFPHFHIRHHHLLLLNDGSVHMIVLETFTQRVIGCGHSVTTREWFVGFIKGRLVEPRHSRRECQMRSY